MSDPKIIYTAILFK